MCYVYTFYCVCLPLPSNQSFYRLITGYWMGGGDHEVYTPEVKGGHWQTN